MSASTPSTENQSNTISFLIPASTASRSSGGSNSGLTLPRALGGTSRAAGSSRDPFINDKVVSVETVFNLAGSGRGASPDALEEAIANDRILALEASDGTTIIMRASKLKEDLQRLYPEKTGAGDNIDLRVLRDEEAAARGIGNWIWSKLSVLSLAPDGLVETAKDKALELLEEKLGRKATDLAAAGASWAGAKALMWAIESKLTGEPGLYRWQDTHLHPGQRVDANNADLLTAAEKGQPILLFIHGTASSTFGSFGQLRSGDDEARWENLTHRFAGQVYGFEHRTFSESPLDNALQLARSLPAGARISLVTHSRGGLIGDLLCLGDFDDTLVQRYQRMPVEKDGEEESEQNRKLREQVVTGEQEQLRTLRQILRDKQFRIERYMRVACPASGTTLLSDNLDLFLSSLLSLLNLGVSLIPAVGTMGSTALSAFRRIVLEIAEKRIDPRLVPGIEAMLPESPLTALLAQAPRCNDVKMAVIAGDADGDSGGFLKRIAIMFTDWIMFDQFDNDFVVDTQSMRAGLSRRNPTFEYYAYGPQVTHLHYFQRVDTRRALHQWLNSDNPEKLPAFNAIPTDCDIKLDEVKGLDTAPGSAARGAALQPGNAPVVFYLPGVMGTHLEIRKTSQGRGEGDRVWFDPFHLAAGGIDQISIDKKNVLPEGLFLRYYGKLWAYLEHEHEVEVFDYDWRRSIDETAKDLIKRMEQKLTELEEQPHRPVSILAHSMGGLVVRSMIAQRPDLWKKICQRPASHFVMLGTPNQGSHAMVETLLGKASAVRKLAMIDFHHDLQEIIDVIDDFDGVLQLLPRPGFEDTGIHDARQQEAGHLALDYLDQPSWETVRQKNHDRWFRFRDGLGAMPHKNRLKKARDFWDKLNAQNALNGIDGAGRIAYVFGLDGHTPCGLTHQEGSDRLYLHGTVQGDGSVSWDAGRLQCLTDERYWYMPATHSDLTNTEAYFPAIVELLRTGKTLLLPQKAPRTRSAASRTYRYDAGPVLQPGAEDLALSFFGGRPYREPEVDQTQVLEVGVQAMDLRFAQYPILCGHYQADSIAGAEYQIDVHLLNGALSQRERMGIYAGAIGTSTIVLNPRSIEDLRRGTGRGAIIIGLGEWSQINAQSIVDSVRDGVLQYLLHTRADEVNGSGKEDDTVRLNLSSLLIGYNSTTHITVEASIEAIVRGVCEANQQYRYNRTQGQPLRAIAKLEFIEFYLDTAITAAYTVRDLPQRLEKELKRLDARIQPMPELQIKQGMRQRLSERSSGGGYWPRMMVTDADNGEEQCPPECYQDRIVSAIPKQVLAAWKKQAGIEEQPENSAPGTRQALAERLKYVYLSERARAEAIVQQRQPGLIEALIKDAIRSCEHTPDICRTLFQLMVPLDFKSAARQTDRMLLIVDGYTANLPWEMLQADEEPLAVRMAVVRQLVSTRFRKKVASTLSQTACVIGNPATTGFFRHFPLPGNMDREGDLSLKSLPGAVEEAQTVTKTLTAAGYSVTPLYPQTPDEAPLHSAIDVFNVLFKQPYRILMIAAHGEVNIRGRDGKERTGVVLSDGVMLTAAEIGQMEEVPDLVFLNCCHLAKADNSPNSGYNRLAYSISRELIEMGVRCVIAAGWAVDDAAAATFSSTFFQTFVRDGRTFGHSVWEARKQTWKLHHGLNTWGAYQAYGDPNYVLRTDESGTGGGNHWSPVAPQELCSKLENLAVDIRYKSSHYTIDTLLPTVDRLLERVPQGWLKEPGIQYKLACLYGDMLPDGFERARSAYQTAIIEEDQKGNVPIQALEALANLEARQAEELAQRAETLSIDISKLPADAAEALEKQSLKESYLADSQNLIDTAIKRLQGLLGITHTLGIENSGSTGKCSVNTERYALLGSAYKRQAIISLRRGNARWEDVAAALEESRRYYQLGEGLSFDYSFKPYTVVNRLQLDGILDKPLDNQIQLAEKAQVAARQHFTESYAFFDAIIIGDAAVAIFLLDESQLLKDTPDQTVEDYLSRLYRTSISEVSYTSKQINSVVRQLEYLIRFLRDRSGNAAKKQQDAAKAKTLQAVISDLQQARA